MVILPSGEIGTSFALSLAAIISLTVPSRPITWSRNSRVGVLTVSRPVLMTPFGPTVKPAESEK